MMFLSIFLLFCFWDGSFAVRSRQSLVPSFRRRMIRTFEWLHRNPLLCWNEGSVSTCLAHLQLGIELRVSSTLSKFSTN